MQREARDSRCVVELGQEAGGGGGGDARVLAQILGMQFRDEL